MAVALERPNHRLAHLISRVFAELFHNGADNLAGGLFHFVGHLVAQGKQGGDQMDVRLQSLEQFGLEQHLGQPARPLEGIFLNHHERVGVKERANLSRATGGCRGWISRAACAGAVVHELQRVV